MDVSTTIAMLLAGIFNVFANVLAAVAGVPEGHGPYNFTHSGWSPREYCEYLAFWIWDDPALLGACMAILGSLVLIATLSGLAYRQHRRRLRYFLLRLDEESAAHRVTGLEHKLVDVKTDMRFMTAHQVVEGLELLALAQHGELQGLLGQLAQAQSRELSLENDKAQAAVQQQTTNEELVKAKRTCDKLQKSLSGAEEQTKASQQEARNRDQELEQAKKACGDLQSRLSGAEERAESLKQDLEDRAKELEEVKTASKKSLSEAEERAEGLEREATGRDKELNEGEKARDALQSSTFHAEERAKALQQLVTDREGELEESRCSYSTLQQSVSAIESHSKDIQQQLSERDEGLQTAQADAQASYNSAFNAKCRTETLERELKDRDQRLAEAEGARDDLEQLLSEADALFISTNEQLFEVTNAYELLLNENSRQDAEARSAPEEETSTRPMTHNELYDKVCGPYLRGQCPESGATCANNHPPICEDLLAGTCPKVKKHCPKFHRKPCSAVKNGPCTTEGCTEFHPPEGAPTRRI